VTAPVDQRAQAAAQAAALLAAVKSGQDVTAVVAQAVSATAQASQYATDSATRMIVALWRSTNPNDAAAVAKFVQQAGGVIVAAQKAVASTAVAGQLTQLRAMGIDTKVAVTIPDDVRGAHIQLGTEVAVKPKPKVTVEYKTPDGEEKRQVTKADAAPERVFNRVVVTYNYKRSQGADHATANKAAEDRIESIVDGNVTLAQRLGEQQTLAKVHAINERVIGWRRVIHPELSKGGVCGLCVAASDRVYGVKELKPIHARCKCSVSPVTKSNDPGHRLNSADLDRLYGVKELKPIHARCKCSVSPVTKSNDPGHRLNSADLDRLYDDAGQSTDNGALKRTRYNVVHHGELGPVLTRVEGEKVPYYSTEKPAAASDRPRRLPAQVKPTESAEEVAARHLPALRASLKRLRDKGLAEDSAPIQYHLGQIAKFEALAKAA